MTIGRCSSAPGHGAVAHALVSPADVSGAPVGRPIALELRLPDGTTRKARGILYRPRIQPPNGRVCVALWLRDEAVAGVPEQTAVWVEDAMLAPSGSANENRSRAVFGGGAPKKP
jgi:hypothetical protein